MMTVDEIMKLADDYRAAWGDGDEDMPRAVLRAAIEAQAARIAELEELLQQAEANFADALVRAALHPEVKP